MGHSHFGGAQRNKCSEFFYICLILQVKYNETVIFQNQKISQDAGVFRNFALRFKPDDGLGDFSADVLHLRGLSLYLN